MSGPTLQVCLCGSAAGYPHSPACPRPLYRSSPEAERAWSADHAKKLRELAEHESCGAWCAKNPHRHAAESSS